MMKLGETVDSLLGSQKDMHLYLRKPAGEKGESFIWVSRDFTAELGIIKLAFSNSLDNQCQISGILIHYHV